MSAKARSRRISSRTLNPSMPGMIKPERLQQTIDLAAVEIPNELWPELEALAPKPIEDPEASRRF